MEEYKINPFSLVKEIKLSNSAVRLIVSAGQELRFISHLEQKNTITTSTRSAKNKGPKQVVKKK